MTRDARQIRQSQTVSPFGVGGIFDVQGESFIACDTGMWRRPTEITSRLAAALRVQGLKAAPALEVDSSGRAQPSPGVPYARFPAWLFCQDCRRMRRCRPSDEQGHEAPTCASCASERSMVPMRWVQVCEAGHLSDVDWRYWAHHGQTEPERRQCQVRDRLRFLTQAGGGSAGLDSLVITCDACGSSRSLIGITKATTLQSMRVRCEGRQPWQGFDVPVCDEAPRAVQRGASNVYFPLTVSAIEIPSLTDDEHAGPDVSRVMGSPYFAGACATDETDHRWNTLIQMLVDDTGVSEEVVVAAVRSERGGHGASGGSEDSPPRDLLVEEWSAFLAGTATPATGGDFVVRRVPVLGPDQHSRPDLSLLEALTDRVVVVDRLREVRALLGFNRVRPAGGAKFVRPSLTPQPRWLPAVEVYGEGVLLVLDETRLREWESRDDVQARTGGLADRLEHHFMSDRLALRTGPTLLPRYVLLHTLAHLLIRRLAFESGYSTASLRERVYGHSGDGGPASRPHGVLIYTAAGDSEGTLGGLARQGEPGVLADSVAGLLSDAAWCSADPLCSENRGSGFGALNNAACHACSLVPETSCESSNLLLDRAMLIGDGTVLGFFEHVAQSTRQLAADGVQDLS